MGSPFGCLFGFIFAILAVLFVAVLNITRRVKDIMSVFSQKEQKQQTTDRNKDRQSTNRNATQASRQPHKVFDDNEGEYIDYEEVE